MSDTHMLNGKNLPAHKSQQAKSTKRNVIMICCGDKQFDRFSKKNAKAHVTKCSKSKGIVWSLTKDIHEIMTTEQKTQLTGILEEFHSSVSKDDWYCVRGNYIRIQTQDPGSNSGSQDPRSKLRIRDPYSGSRIQLRIQDPRSRIQKFSSERTF